MALNSSKVESTQGNRPKAENLEAGNYMGRVVQVLDLGLQPQRPYQGEEKPPAHEIMLTYELGTEFLPDENGNAQTDKPRWLSETFPLRHMNSELAKSTKRMKSFDPSNSLKGDFSLLPGMTCTVTVGVWVSKQDPTKSGNSVLNVTPAMKGFPVPELVNPPKVFDLDNPDMEVFGSLPEWIQEKIKGNLRFTGSALEAATKGGVAPSAQQANKPPQNKVSSPDVAVQEDDNNPF